MKGSFNPPGGHDVLVENHYLTPCHDCHWTSLDFLIILVFFLSSGCDFILVIIINKYNSSFFQVCFQICAFKNQLWIESDVVKLLRFKKTLFPDQDAVKAGAAA